MQDHTNAPNEHMPQPVGKESSHSLKYIIGLAFFIAWTGLVGFVGYQLKVVVDYIEGPEVEDVEEVDDEVEEETSMYIDTEDGLRVEYDYEKHDVTTELSALLGTDAHEYCYRFTEGIGSIEDRIEDYDWNPDYEPIDGWSSLDAIESPRPETDPTSISHFCATEFGELIVEGSFGYEQGDDSFAWLIDWSAQDRLIVFEDRNLDSWLVSQVIMDDTLYLVFQYGDAGVSVWEAYKISRGLSRGILPSGLQMPDAELVESCTSRDSSDMSGYAVLDCEVHTGLVTEDLDSDEE